MQYAISVGALEEENYYTNLNTSLKIFNKAGEEQTKEQREEVPAIKFLMAISELISSGQILILSLGEAIPDIGTVYGYREDEIFYLFPGLVYNKVVEYYQKRNELFPVGKSRLLNDLAKLECITTQSGRNTIKKNGISGRVIALKKNALDSANE